MNTSGSAFTLTRTIDETNFDVAIIGENLLVEKGGSIEVLEYLDFSRCKVSLAVPKTFPYKSTAFLGIFV